MQTGKVFVLLIPFEIPVPHSKLGLESTRESYSAVFQGNLYYKFHTFEQYPELITGVCVGGGGGGGVQG